MGACRVPLSFPWHDMCSLLSRSSAGGRGELELNLAARTAAVGLRWHG